MIFEYNEKTRTITPANFDVREMQSVLKDIILAIDKVCKEHNLKYYIIAGTMLGAIRHKGFLPWDDDGDIAMPRKDYEIFLEHANEWLPKEYELVSGNNNSNYPYLFARVQDKRTTYILRRRFNHIGGVPIDIFPLDGMTKNPILRRIHYMRYNFWKRMYYFTQVNPYKFGKWSSHYLVCIICSKLFPKNKLYKHLNSIQQEFNFEKSEYIADHDNKPERGILAKEIYGNPTPITFEDITINGVEQPEKYLSYCYGDYLTIPSKEKRPHLNFRYLNLNEPYSEYLKKHK